MQTVNTMAHVIRIRKFGGSLGVILPKEVSSALALEEGDEVFVSASADGIQISQFDPDFDEAMADAREFMRTHRDAFRKLAE
jgi:putative addiction module antidote